MGSVGHKVSHKNVNNKIDMRLTLERMEAWQLTCGEGD